MSMTISYSVTGRTEQTWEGADRNKLCDRNGEVLDVQAEVDRIVSIVPVGQHLRITIETVDG